MHLQSSLDQEETWIGSAVHEMSQSKNEKHVLLDNKITKSSFEIVKVLHIPRFTDCSYIFFKKEYLLSLCN